LSTFAAIVSSLVNISVFCLLIVIQLVNAATRATLPAEVQERLVTLDRRKLLLDMFTGIQEIHARELGPFRMLVLLVADL
jgi:hypothetical protein